MTLASVILRRMPLTGGAAEDIAYSRAYEIDFAPETVSLPEL
jgi:hypothetical protein